MANSGATTYAYDAVGNLTLQVLPNQIAVRSVYDARDRATSIRYLHPAGMDAAAFSYTYDALGNRVTAQEYLNGTVTNLAWSYDAANRLTRETRTDVSAAPLYQTAYRYDLTGNRLTQTQNGLTIDYSYDALDQLLAVSSSTLTAQYTYTPNGTRSTLTTPAATVSYAYDALDRLLSVTAQPSMGAPTAHAFTYDADGRMVTSGTRQFLWDEVSTYGDIVAEFDGGQLDASYVLGGSRLISQTTGTDSAYFLTDALGSTRALSDGAASLTDTFTYDAYGGLYSADPFADFSTTATPYLFTGHRYDSALGLYHARARVYDPSVGRFLSRDTWPVDYSNPIELNRYSYVAGNPVNATDPTGLFSLPSKAAITQTVIGIGTYLSTVGRQVYDWLYSLWVRLAQFFVNRPVEQCLLANFFDVPVPDFCGAGGQSYLGQLRQSLNNSANTILNFQSTDGIGGGGSTSDNDWITRILRDRSMEIPDDMSIEIAGEMIRQRLITDPNVRFQAEPNEHRNPDVVSVHQIMGRWFIGLNSTLDRQVATVYGGRPLSTRLTRLPIGALGHAESNAVGEAYLHNREQTFNSIPGIMWVSEEPCSGCVFLNPVNESLPPQSPYRGLINQAIFSTGISQLDVRLRNTGSRIQLSQFTIIAVDPRINR